MGLAIPKCDYVKAIGDDDFSFFARNGYLIIKNPFGDELIDELAEWTRKSFWDENGILKDLRTQDEWLKVPAVKKLATHPTIMAKVEELYGRKPIPFQTLNFPVGTQQNTHSDTIHFHSFPQRWMCGVWVAFEDITPLNGPLHYYPGSHRLPIIELEDAGVDVAEHQDGEEHLTQNQRMYRKYELAIQELLDEAGIEREILCVEKGDVLIWAANLLHGGSKIEQEGTTRMSQVTHYYFEDCRYFTPLLSDMQRGKFFYRNNVLNIENNEPVGQFFDIPGVNAPVQEAQTVVDTMEPAASEPQAHAQANGQASLLRRGVRKILRILR
ncbi:MAG: phytanoyl-CoA dioxygenase family protein [Pseudohongiellaceae bacterium]|nr:phytanoyl-CoA dioxygenase family protein [Pseudohongiellaceae bacterium]